MLSFKQFLIEVLEYENLDGKRDIFKHRFQGKQIGFSSEKIKLQGAPGKLLAKHGYEIHKRDYGDDSYEYHLHHTPTNTTHAMVGGHHDGKNFHEYSASLNPSVSRKDIPINMSHFYAGLLHSTDDHGNHHINNYHHDIAQSPGMIKSNERNTYDHPNIQMHYRLPGTSKTYPLSDIIERPPNKKNPLGYTDWDAIKDRKSEFEKSKNPEEDGIVEHKIEIISKRRK